MNVGEAITRACQRQKTDDLMDAQRRWQVLHLWVSPNDEPSPYWPALYDAWEDEQR